MEKKNILFFGGGYIKYFSRYTFLFFLSDKGEGSEEQKVRKKKGSEKKGKGGNNMFTCI